MITEFFTDDHRACDALFVDAENAAHKGNLTEAKNAFEAFEQALQHHLSQEETVLFPAFEQQSGMTGGPTAVMRMEHEQMRDLLTQLHNALAQNDSDAFLGYAETLNILIQQHNMKEEQMLYPMCDRLLGPQAADVLAQAQAL